MLVKFQESWCYTRAIMLFLFVAFLSFMAIKGYSWSLEMEFVGPGSEVSRLEKEYTEHINKEAYERVFEGCDIYNEHEIERACAYGREHGA